MKHYFHHEQKKGGKTIIIDAAALNDTPYWSNEVENIEIMVMYAGGEEIESKIVNDYGEAKRVFNGYVAKYFPLSGKYAKLRDDLKRALQAGETVERADPDDGGTCNFDGTAVLLPRWTEKLVERAAEEAGTGCFKWDLWKTHYYVFRPKTRGRANARSRNAEAVTKAMMSYGYDCMDYQQAD